MQISLFKERGGKRRGAGRKPKGLRAGVPHTKRPKMSRHHPVHVTMRVGGGIDDLRGPSMFSAVKTAILAGADRFGTRIVEFSAQQTHLHLIIETSSKEALTRAMKGLCVRLARAINNVMGRRGNVFPDRYHARALRSPREIRLALVYCLCNRRKHRGVDSANIAPRELPAPQSWLLRQQYRKKDIETSSIPKVSKRREQTSQGPQKQTRLTRG